MASVIAEYRDLFARMGRRPRMYLMRDDFAGAVAYIEGCDQGSARTLLTGFREWLLTQAGCGDNLVWWGLVLKIDDPDRTGSGYDLSAEADADANRTLFRLIDEFLELRQEPDGLRRIHAAYENWRTARAEHGCVGTGAPACPRVPWPRSASHRPQAG
jgi:hypothetical protein